MTDIDENKTIGSVFMNPKQLAKALGVSIRWLERNRKGNRVIPYTKDGKFIRYKWSDVESWMRKYRVK